MAGNVGAWCLMRAGVHVTEFQMITSWTSLQAIEGFAGRDIERANYDFDRRYLRSLEPTVRHYD